MKIDITPSLSIFSTYKNFKYQLPSALFEFFDNSTSSFFEKGDKKDDRYVITLIDRRDKDNKKILIIDNAYGMNDSDFVRAIKIDNKRKTTQRNKFGVGLKVSAIWFSDIWTIETLENKTKKHRKFTFDLEKIQNSKTNVFESEDLKTEIIGGEYGLSFERGTIIELIEPREFPTSKVSATKLIDSISNQFSDDISNENVKFILAEVTTNKFGNMEFKDITEQYSTTSENGVFRNELLKCKPIKEREIKWHVVDGEEIFEEIEIEVSDYNDLSTYIIKGIVGWREDSGVGKGGFKRLWNGRALESNIWKPERVVGLSNTYTGQRLYGVLDFSKFEPSNSKDSFLINSNLEIEIEDAINKKIRNLKSKINRLSKEQAKITKELKRTTIDKSFDKTNKDFQNNIKSYNAQKILINSKDKFKNGHSYKNVINIEKDLNISIDMKITDQFENHDLIKLQTCDTTKNTFEFLVNSKHPIIVNSSTENINNITNLIYVICFSEARAIIDYHQENKFTSFSHIKAINVSLKGGNDE